MEDRLAIDREPQQGSIIIFIILIFYYAIRMNAIDRKFGAEE